MASITRQFPSVTPRTLWRKIFWRHARVPVVLVVSCALVTALSLPYLHLDSQSNNLAWQVVKLSRRRAELRRDVSELERQLATRASLHNMTRRAAALGFEESSEVRVLVLDRELDRPEATPSAAIVHNLDWLKSLLNGGRDELGDVR